MKCVDFEQLIALYVEDDLSTAERIHVEAHLEHCLACQSLVHDLKDSQVSFKSTRNDVPSSEELALIYQRIAAEAGSVREMTWFEQFFFRGFRRTVAFAGIGLVVAGVGALWMARESRVVPASPTQIAVNVPPVVQAPAVSAPTPKAVPPAVAKRARRRVSAPQPRQVALKFLTDDPQVIIYWLVDEKGD